MKWRLSVGLFALVALVASDGVGISDEIAAAYYCAT